LDEVAKTIINYQYDAANQLLTAQKGESLWSYVYDANGSLVEVLPNGSEASGAKRYTLRQAQGKLYTTPRATPPRWRRTTARVGMCKPKCPTTDSVNA
jgi:YD repeat-containing protein